MLTHLRPALSMMALFTLLTGLAYPLAMTGMAQALFPTAANGSLIEKDGRVVGAAVIAQPFALLWPIFAPAHQPVIGTLPEPGRPTLGPPRRS